MHHWLGMLVKDVRNDRWSVKDIHDLTGKTVVITGANTGLGFESAKVLAMKNAEVILACRSIEKSEAACAEIRAHQAGALLEVIQLDLGSLDSIKTFITQFSKKYSQLDILLNNAGIMNTPYGLTIDGFEQQFGTNHLGHFALTGLLLPQLKQTPASRVVTVSSSGHRAGKMDFDNLLFEGGKGYSPLKAYGRSKLANLLFAYELQNRFDRHGLDCKSLAAHPGASQTDLGRHIEDQWFFRTFEPMLRKVIQSAEQGALPQLRAATDTDALGGEYYGPGGFMEMAGKPVKVQSGGHEKALADI